MTFGKDGMTFESAEDHRQWKAKLRELNTESIGERVYRMREYAEMTQVQLAEVAGCSANVIKEIEKNRNLDGKAIGYIRRICEYFNCSIDWLLCESNLPVCDHRTEDLANYLNLSPDATDVLVSVLKNITSDSGRQKRRGLNHLITTDPLAFEELCFSLEEFSKMQLVPDHNFTDHEIKPWSTYQLGRAWQLIEKIFLAATKKEKAFIEAKKKAKQD